MINNPISRLKHAITHAKGGVDAITPDSIGAAALGDDGYVLPSQLKLYVISASEPSDKTLFWIDSGNNYTPKVYDDTQGEWVALGAVFK